MADEKLSPSDADLARKLDVLIRLTATSVVGERTGGEAIEVLVRAGLENDLIAELVGTTPGTVRARRADITKRKGAKK